MRIPCGYVSNYARDGNGEGEDFAESVAAYLNARDHGPAALAEFREAYPNRAEYIEKNVLSNPSDTPPADSIESGPPTGTTTPAEPDAESGPTTTVPRPVESGPPSATTPPS